MTMCDGKSRWQTAPLEPAWQPSDAAASDTSIGMYVSFGDPVLHCSIFGSNRDTTFQLPGQSSRLSMLRRSVFAHRHYSELCSTPFSPYHQRCIMNIAISSRRVQTYPSRPDAVSVAPKLLGPGRIPPTSRLYSVLMNHHIPSLVQCILSKNETESHKLRNIRASPKTLKYFINVSDVRHVSEALACVEPHRVVQFIALSWKLGCHHKQNVYECVCFRLANAKHWLRILDVVSLGAEHTGRTTSRLLNWKARSLLELKRYGQLTDMLEEFKLHNMKPNRRTYHLVLTGHLRNSDMLQARDCLRLMAEAGFSMDPSSHAILATNYRSLGSDPNVESRALQVLGDMDNATSVAVLNSLIQTRLHLHDIPGALHLFTYFAPSSVQALASALSGARRPEGLPRYGFSHQPHPSLEHPLIPNASTYAAVIRYLTGRVDINVLLDVSRAMNVNGVMVTPAVVISLVHAVTSAGYIDIAVKLIADTCDERKILRSMFVPLVSDGLDLRLPIDCTGVQPSAALFNALLEHSLRLCGFKAMFTILRVMRINGVMPNSATLDVFISYLLKQENVRPRSILRMLRHLYSDTVPPTPHHLHVVLSCVFRYEKFLLYGSGWNHAFCRLWRSRDTPSRPYPESRMTNTSDPFDPTAGLQMPRHLQYKALARPLIELLSTNRIKSDAATFALRIRHDAVIRSDLDSAENMFRTLLNRGIHATEHHYSALMEGYALSGQMDRAEDLLKSMRNAGLEPNVVIYTILITGHGRSRNPGKALRMFRQMINDGCQPDVPAIDALCRAFFASGARVTAKKLLISCWAYIQPFPDELCSLPLRELAIRFRSLHKDGHCVPQKMSKQRRRLLHFKIRKFMERWKYMSVRIRKKSCRWAAKKGRIAQAPKSGRKVTGTG